jgi:ankyrin repeat protein
LLAKLIESTEQGQIMKTIVAIGCLFATNLALASQPPDFQAATDSMLDIALAGAALPLCRPDAITPALRADLSSKLAVIDTLGLSDTFGYSPLDYAVIADDVAAMERFVAMGYRIGAGTSGQTPMHGAAQFGSRRAMAWLLAHGADVDARDEVGTTPLMLATSANRLDVVRDLLAAGADPGATADRFATPLTNAVLCSNAEMIEALRAAGAPIDHTAREVARKHGVSLP